MPEIDINDNQVFYTAKINYQNKKWNSLRLGFFESKSSATKVLNEIKKTYPDAFLGIVSQAEVQYSKKTIIHKKTSLAERLLIKAEDILASPPIRIPISKKSTNQQEDTKHNIDNYFVINLSTTNDLSKFNQHTQTGYYA